MDSSRKELVADVQLLLGTDAHECFDIRLLERTEHVVDFLHGSLLGRGEPPEPPSRESAVSSRCTASPARHGPRRPGRPARRSSKGARSATGWWQLPPGSRLSDLPDCKPLLSLRYNAARTV